MYPTIPSISFQKLQRNTLTKEDLLNYYQGEDVKDKFRIIENEINALK